MVREINVDEFSNDVAFEMGLKVIELARSRGVSIAVSVDRLNHTVFRFVSDSMPADKQDWLRRKANVAIRFEESSLAVKEELAKKNMTLIETFGLEAKDYVAKGGSIPIKVNAAGLIATVTVSGLSDVDDHELITTALCQYL